MLNNKIYVWLIIGLMFGLVLGMPLQGASDVVVGWNHWSHDKTNNYLYPTNDSVNVSLNNNSLVYADLSGFAGDDISWDAADQEFDVTGNGSSKWNDNGTTLFTKTNGRDVQVNGTFNILDTYYLTSPFDDVLYLNRSVFGIDQILFFNDVNHIGIGTDVFVPSYGITLGGATYVDGDLEVAGNLDIANLDTGSIFLDDEIIFDGLFGSVTIAGNTESIYLNTTGGVFVDDSITASAFFGDGGNLTNISSDGFWNRYGTVLSPATDGDDVQLNGTLDVIHTATEADDHALEIVADASGFGDVKALDIDYITGAIVAGQDDGIILINIDEILALGGDVFALEVLATNGSAGIYGLKAGVGIGPIHQDAGVFVNPTTGTDNTPSTDVPAMIDGAIGTTTTIFEADNEYIIIGSATAFEETEFIFTVVSSNPGIKPTFWYSTAGAGQFTQFTPVDGTNGFRNTGVVAWDASDLTGHTTNDDTGTYDIKVIRTQNNLQTEPVLGYAKTASTTEYVWDKDGNLTINGITGNGSGLTGSPTFDSLTVSDILINDGVNSGTLRTTNNNATSGINIGIPDLGYIASAYFVGSVANDPGTYFLYDVGGLGWVCNGKWLPGYDRDRFMFSKFGVHNGNEGDMVLQTAGTSNNRLVYDASAVNLNVSSVDNYVNINGETGDVNVSDDLYVNDTVTIDDRIIMTAGEITAEPAIKITKDLNAGVAQLFNFIGYAKKTNAVSVIADGYLYDQTNSSLSNIQGYRTTIQPTAVLASGIREYIGFDLNMLPSNVDGGTTDAQHWRTGYAMDLQGLWAGNAEIYYRDRCFEVQDGGGIVYAGLNIDRVGFLYEPGVWYASGAPDNFNMYGLKLGDFSASNFANGANLSYAIYVEDGLTHLGGNLNVTRDTNITGDLTVNESESFTWSSYASVTTTANSDASISVNVFDEDDYTSYTHDNNTNPTGIIYYPSNGSFVFNNSGIYQITFNGIVQASVTATYFTNLSKNGANFYSHDWLIHTAVDPPERSITIQQEFAVGDELQVIVASTGAVATCILHGGSTLSINRIA